MAFALDMFQQTNNNFGVNEVLLASVLGQPLCIRWCQQVTQPIGPDKPYYTRRLNKV